MRSRRLERPAGRAHRSASCSGPVRGTRKRSQRSGGSSASSPSRARAAPEAAGDQLGAHALAAHALAPGRVVVPAAVQLAHLVHHLGGTVREGLAASRGRAGRPRAAAGARRSRPRRAGVPRRREDPLDLVVGQPRHHRRHHHPDRAAGVGQAPGSPGAAAPAPVRAAPWRGRSRATSVVTDTPDPRQPGAAHLAEDVGVALDQHPLGTTVTGWRNSLSTSRTPRMMPNRFSIG